MNAKEIQTYEDFLTEYGKRPPDIVFAIAFKAGQMAVRQEANEWYSHPCSHYRELGIDADNRKCPGCLRDKLRDWGLTPQ